MFRLLGKINIATQLTLLVTVVAVLAVYVVSRAGENRTRDLLVERSDVSLADECLLRGYALREAVRNLAGEARRRVENHARVLRDGNEVSLRDTLGQFLLTGEPLEDDDRAALSEVSLVEVEGGIVKHVLPHVHRTGTGHEPVKLHHVQPEVPSNPAAKELWKRLPKEIAASQPTGKQMYSALTATTHDAYLVAIACPVLAGPRPAPPRVVILTLDFTRLVGLHARRLPRDLVFVHDAKRVFVYHPLASEIGTPHCPWEEALSQSAERVANGEAIFSEPTRGVRLDERRRDDLRFWVVRKPLSEQLNADRQKRRYVEEELSKIDQLRFSRLWGRAVIILASSDRQALLDARKRIDKEERQLAGRATDWSREIACETFVGYHVDHFALDPENKVTFGVVLAGAKEEMTAEVTNVITDLWWFRYFPVLLASAGLALVSAYFLTRPLRRLTEASQRVAHGDYGMDVNVVALGEVGELAHTFQDMTTRIRTRERELRENLARMNTILINAADGIITFDQSGKIEQANAAAEEMFGVGPGGLVGTKVQKLMKLPEHLQKPVPVGALSSGSAIAGHGGTVTQLFNAVKTPGEEHRGLRMDGGTFWMEVTFSQVPLEDRRVITGIFRDVTARKRTEERVRLMNDELDARVRLRTAQLEDAKTKLELALAQAESAAAAKDRFISVVSHELRTPLTSAMGYTELLLNPRATKLRENPGPTLEKILTSCKHLLTLINDLLDVGRYTAGKPIDLAPIRFDLSGFLRGVQEMVAPLIKKNGNALETAIPSGLGEVVNDETRLRQVLLNLLSNASKFTEKGRVCLHVERRRENGADQLVFQISDTGAGMTPEQVEKLFTPFYRVDNSMTRRQGGTGLGLTITKMICELMGGSIRVDSMQGQGSTFTVIVPAEVGAARKAGQPSVEGAKSTAPAKGTVLVIDDDATIRHMLETYLQQEGFHVVLAPTGPEGLRLAREYQPMCITLDVLMPGEDGWDVLARLKNDPATRDIPVIMLTIMEERNRGFALGATEYVTKPIDWGRLGSILCRYQPSGRDGQPILIVEDDALQRGYLREELILAGWAVLEAANGAEALKVCEATTPSLILLDLTMPIMDGFEFLDELRRKEGGADIPVVVVTARELSDADRRRLNRSVAQVLAKESLSKEKLLERIAGQMLHAVRKA